MIERKGLDILEQAIKLVHDQSYKVELDIYGSGSLNLKYPDLPISYKGTLPYYEIQTAIAEHDILILPSRHDGWGAVVNEALFQKVPVIVSDRVGSKCILEACGAGLIFRNEDYRDLAEKIKQIVDDPDLYISLQDKASQVGTLILPEAGARYFVDVLEYYFFSHGVRPDALWCGTEKRQV
jgi:glycosyltransferase involved in cell wall biosynthesis